MPLCFTHLSKVAAALTVGEQTERLSGSAPVEEVPLREGTDYHSIVYYVTWDGGETVKIGTTTSPKARFNAYHKKAGRPVDLLVAHPGSYAEERTNHRRFKHLRMPNERELFRQGTDLVEHIAVVRAVWPNWQQIVNEVAWRAGAKRGKELYAVVNARARAL